MSRDRIRPAPVSRKGPGGRDTPRTAGRFQCGKCHMSIVSHPRIPPPARSADLDRLIAAVGAQTDAMSAVLDQLHALQREAVAIRFRAGVCAVALAPLAAVVVLAVIAAVLAILWRLDAGTGAVLVVFCCGALLVGAALVAMRSGQAFMDGVRGR